MLEIELEILILPTVAPQAAQLRLKKLWRRQTVGGLPLELLVTANQRARFLLRVGPKMQQDAEPPADQPAARAEKSHVEDGVVNERKPCLARRRRLDLRVFIMIARLRDRLLLLKL